SSPASHPAKRNTLRPRGVLRWRSSTRILERLIDAEVLDLQPQRIHPDELVGHMVAQYEVDLCDIGFTTSLCTGSRGVVDLLERDRRLEGWRLQLTQADVLHHHLDLVGGRIRHKHLQDPRLIVLSDRRVSESRIQEEQ